MTLILVTVPEDACGAARIALRSRVDVYARRSTVGRKSYRVGGSGRGRNAAATDYEFVSRYIFHLAQNRLL